VDRGDDAALKDRPKSLNRVGVGRINYVVAAFVMNRLVAIVVAAGLSTMISSNNIRR
jgi:hypothetical protein